MSTVMKFTGDHVSKDGITYFFLIISFALMVASMCIPYYVDSTGTSSGVYGSGKDCLGFPGMQCDVIHTFPVLTTVFVGMTILFMSTHVSIPYLSKMVLKTGVSKLEKMLTGFGITIPVLLFMAMIFIVVTLGTQLGMPLNGSSLSDQAKNSSNTTTFKDGMALTATATALIIVCFLMQTQVLVNLTNIIKARF